MSLHIIDDPEAYASMSRQFTYKLLWRPEKHYVTGTDVELRSHCLRAFLSWRYAGFEMDAGDITFRWKMNPSPSQLRQNLNRVLFRTRLIHGVPAGEPTEFTVTVIPPVLTGVDNILSVWTIDVPNNLKPDESGESRSQPVKEHGSEVTLTVSSGPVERLSIYSRPMPGLDHKVRTVLVPEDRFGNPAVFENKIRVNSIWNERERQVELHGVRELNLEPPTGVGRLEVHVPMALLSARENILNGFRRCDILIIKGNPVWPGGPETLRAGFGEFHWHTGFSGDGQRSIEEALVSARDYLNMDYAAPGDHNPQGEKWDVTVSALNSINRDDEFATFFGWENATDRGHENYYFTDPQHPLVCGGPGGITSGRPDSLVKPLKAIYEKDDFVAVPHHTNCVAETRKPEDDSPYWHTYPWPDPQDYIRLVEIMQTRGNQETNVYDDAWRGWHQNNGASVQDALALGHRVGFTGGSDNHCGWPGRIFDERHCEGVGIHPTNSVILTGVWTRRIERQCIFDSLKARNTWAVWDTRALVHFTVNSALGGDELAVAPKTDLEAHIRLSAEDALQVVELVSQGKVVWQGSFAEPDVELDVPLGRAASSTHFYLRALQRNGGIIYASPVFVTVE